MPRPKVNVRVSYDKAPVAKGVKCNYCSESDCYFIDIDELRDKMLVKDVFMERSFFDRNGDKYYFSNLHIKKNSKDITIEAVFEKQGCDKFIIIDELNNIIANVETVDFEIMDRNWEFFRNYNCSQFNINWIPKRDFLKDAFMRGVYVVKDGKRRYFSRFHVDRDREGVVSVKFDVDGNNVMIQNRGQLKHIMLRKRLTAIEKKHLQMVRRKLRGYVKIVFRSGLVATRAEVEWAKKEIAHSPDWAYRDIEEAIKIRRRLDDADKGINIEINWQCND